MKEFEQTSLSSDQRTLTPSHIMRLAIILCESKRETEVISLNKREKKKRLEKDLQDERTHRMFRPLLPLIHVRIVDPPYTPQRADPVDLLERAGREGAEPLPVRCEFGFTDRGELEAEVLWGKLVQEETEGKR